MSQISCKYYWTLRPNETIALTIHLIDNFFHLFEFRDNGFVQWGSLNVHKVTERVKPVLGNNNVVFDKHPDLFPGKWALVFLEKVTEMVFKTAQALFAVHLSIAWWMHLESSKSFFFRSVASSNSLCFPPATMSVRVAKRNRAYMRN